MKAYPIQGIDQPFEEATRRNSTDSVFTVRVGYKIRRAAEVEGEVAYMDDPHPKVIDLELNAGGDANAIALACEDLEEQIPNEVNAPDRVEIIEIKIVERPGLNVNADDLPLQAGPPPEGDENIPNHFSSNPYNAAS